MKETEGRRERRAEVRVFAVSRAFVGTFLAASPRRASPPHRRVGDLPPRSVERRTESSGSSVVFKWTMPEASLAQAGAVRC